MAEDVTTSSLPHPTPANPIPPYAPYVPPVTPPITRPAAPAIPAPAPLTPTGLAATKAPGPTVPVTAADKLREFEDKHFGKDVSRINGEIEHGVGSPYSRMTPYQKRHYESLEHLVKAEKKVADASAELETAKAKHVAAVKSSDDAAKAIVTADAAAKAEADKPKAA